MHLVRKNNLSIKVYRNLSLNSIITILFILFIASCSEDDALNTPPTADFTYKDEIDRIKLTSISADQDGDELSYLWSTDSEYITINQPDQKIVSFMIPNIDMESTVEIKLTASDGKDSNTITKTIEVPALSECRTLGLGKELTAERSNNVNHNWYIDQMLTGSHANVNCGPTVATMALKWANESFDKSPQDARNTFQPEGGGWYQDVLMEYLDLYNITYNKIRLTETSVLENELNAGNIIILCLDMLFVSYQKRSTWHVDKYYKTEGMIWGHYIIAKGYKKVDNTTFFEIYDPYGNRQLYENGEPKGKDRYYRATDIDIATDIYWDYAIIISPD